MEPKTPLYPQQQVFWERPTTQALSPVVVMPTMSEHIQNHQPSSRPQLDSQITVHIMNMIPQIVAQVIATSTEVTL